MSDETDLRKALAYLHDLDAELEERSAVRGPRANSTAREDMFYQLDDARKLIAALELHASNVSCIIYHDGGEVKSVSATDVNEYLAKASGRTVTSKDFRTWGATVEAAQYLSALPTEKERKEIPAGTIKRNIRDAIRSVSRALGNTPAVCRRSYIHPAVFRCYEAGVAAKPRRRAGLRAKECATLSLLPVPTPARAKRRHAYRTDTDTRQRPNAI